MKQKKYKVMTLTARIFSLGWLLIFCTFSLSWSQSKSDIENTKLTSSEEVSDILVSRSTQEISVSSINQIMSIDFQDVPLLEAMKQVTNDLGMRLTYSKEVLPIDKEVTVNFESTTANEVIYTLLEGTGLRYAISKKGSLIIFEHSSELPGFQTYEQSQQSVTGTVTDGNSGETLPGVNIMVKGTTIGASTDQNGNYELDVPSYQDTLIISFVGYQRREVSINGRQKINIALQPQTIAGEELVVVGYGTQQKSSLTGSIAKVENEDMDQIPVSNVGSALAGRLAGVNIVNSRNRPGESPRIQIRGIGSIDGGNDPLIVIDGFPGGDLDHINMNNVESIEVLKDAAAAAIYGSRGSGGVILVTTKNGSGEPTVELNFNYGMSSPMVHDDWLTGEEWYEYLVKYQNREFAWAGGDVSLPMYGDDRRPLTYQVNPLTYELPQTVWQNEVIQDAPFSNYNISVGGGQGDTHYNFSGSFIGEEGNIKTASYKQYNFRANVDTKINDWIDAGFQLSPSYSKRRIAGSNMVSLVKYPPFVSPNKMDGAYPRTQDYISSGHSGQASPYTYLYGRHNEHQEFKSLGRGFVNLELLEGLMFNSSIGTEITYNSIDNFTGSLGDEQINNDGYASDYRSINLVNENTLNYNRTFSLVHDIAILAGASFQHQTARGTNINAIAGSYNNEIIQTLNNATIDPSSTNTTKSEWGLVSYFGRLNYTFDDRYLFSASVRTDGSSRFGPDNKWAIFPAASIAWRLANENFMEGVSTISELKVRASYGTTGNFNIGNYAHLGRVGFTSYSPGNNREVGLAPTSLGNPKLSWEKTISYNLGFELGMFDDRFYMNLDLYDKKTSNLLYNVSIPAITGFNTTLSNIGEVNNRGVELEITSRNMTGSFNWQTSFNISRNINEVVDLGEVDEHINNHYLGMSWLLREGEPMFSYYGYEMVGVYQSEAELENSAHLPGAKPGNPIVKDQNSDGIINPEDKVNLGNYHPDVTLGMVNDFSWKNFDLSLTIESSLGAEIFNFENQYYEGNTLGAMRRSLVEDQWWSAEEPGDGETPAAALSQLIQYNASTDFYVENASFLALRNMNFGYSIPDETANKIRLKRLRIYASINNLLVIRSKGNHAYNPIGTTSSGVSGLNSTPGFNSGSEPISRVFTLGISLEL